MNKTPIQDKGGPEKVQTEEEKTQAQEMAQLKAEVNSLWEEYKAQLDVRGKQQESEAGFKQQIDSLFEKRDALKKERVSHLIGSSLKLTQLLRQMCDVTLIPCAWNEKLSYWEKYDKD